MNGENEMALPCRVDCHEVCAYHFCICQCHAPDAAAVASPEPDDRPVVASGVPQ